MDIIVDITTVIVALITAGIPAIVTAICSYFQHRTAKRHAAKQSILQMVMEDQLSWELFKKFPVNYGNINDEYAIYHKNGGNGEVTKKVNEYNNWYISVEASVASKRKEEI
ncbi:MAG: hypothetical protein Q4E47_01190 [Candidatus Saccharibacteria bacterium]|nr:hypothetical protein [Candidatus Saccharibacteria bacterium]